MWIDNPDIMTAPYPRILSLDGGGIRGLSSLQILEKIMERIREMTNASTIPKPCECFDLICGTSTGGLIAIMLGRLRMVSSR
jgi:patatin-like phospholipase/acyl hydrolase